MLIPSAIVFAIFCVFIGLGAQHSVFAQSEEWKTYINPEYKFSIDYPHMETNVANILIIGDKPKISNNLESEIDFSLLISQKNDSNDIKPYVEYWLQKDLSNELRNVTIFDPLHPVIFANSSGYEYVTYNGKDSLRTNIFLDHDDKIFFFTTSNPTTDFNLDKFYRSVNSTKFFD
ncbi:hypothetical protein [Candidatus Nitrosocosmicus sp. SS]|jgi:hypothetical protein|uniref:hypothetical protein n=1 Tax=Candidatus Nitrosocosmicus agrestis TaxID=2563600 RepID=UPI00122E8206|nr:hypothetical protein [Candidatus Nitrosocosmicus sp. SS]KAA2279385.1 hypothetical protein F1Z66_13425 [Candidatus Nitrosocosmicus sp. SS]KAF0868073.1 hypothetical protein E5N71_11970 [Candidatus Nitrosocosmicus sp. SS]